MRDLIYRTIGIGAPFWKTRSGLVFKAFLNISRWAIFGICWLILLWFGYALLVGLSNSEPDYENSGGGCIPYGDCY